MVSKQGHNIKLKGKRIMVSGKKYRFFEILRNLNTKQILIIAKKTFKWYKMYWKGINVSFVCSSAHLAFLPFLPPNHILSFIFFIVRHFCAEDWRTRFKNKTAKVKREEGYLNNNICWGVRIYFLILHIFNFHPATTLLIRKRGRKERKQGWWRICCSPWMQSPFFFHWWTVD